MAHRDDPLPLATMAAELLARAAKRKDLDADADLAGIIADLAEALPVLRNDEPHVLLWSKYATAMREREQPAPEADA